VPQFTLYADTRKGNRPGFEASADPDTAKGLWARFNTLLREGGVEVREGIFGAHMEVELVNDGPVTLWLDSAPPDSISV
jgi:D-tyrosyl-tRNA(Tyr) deacylase